jgi:hypothetical protein
MQSADTLRAAAGLFKSVRLHASRNQQVAETYVARRLAAFGIEASIVVDDG